MPNIDIPQVIYPDTKVCPAELKQMLADWLAIEINEKTSASLGAYQ